MFEDHDDFELPNPRTTIWRYMSEQKFERLLVCSSLWLARSDQFEDKMEGHFSSASHVALDAFFGGRRRAKPIRDVHDNLNRQARSCVYINCWHMNEKQSVPLWQTYAQDGKAVAIKSTMARLRKALDKSDVTVHGSVVQYRDYAKDVTPMGNLLNTFIHKRSEFAFENELRILAWRTDMMDSSETPVGMPIAVELKDLIDKVYLAPKASVDFEPRIRELLDRAGLVDLNVERSMLFDGPTYDAP